MTDFRSSTLRRLYRSAECIGWLGRSKEVPYSRSASEAPTRCAHRLPKLQTLGNQHFVHSCTPSLNFFVARAGRTSGSRFPRLNVDVLEFPANREARLAPSKVQPRVQFHCCAW